MIMQLQAGVNFSCFEINSECIYTWFYENRAAKKSQSLALIVNLVALVT